MNYKKMAVITSLVISWTVGNKLLLGKLLFNEPSFREAVIATIALGIWMYGFFSLGMQSEGKQKSRKHVRYFCLISTGLVLFLLPLSKVDSIIATIISCVIVSPLTVPMMYFYNQYSFVEMEALEWMLCASTYLMLYVSYIVGEKKMQNKKNRGKRNLT